ncbi:hypothetical protein PIIN_03709 [Serendipita indica DSM 11827]|uniref:Uncharacterized protein n=1 Tax=Serendipita indica (strain DSM 11827) TaxID=1109443 RepID=G4TEN2_SERID|nr:hypothetical protein PIIN_03709 [Serendipita indica DSM 11827]
MVMVKSALGVMQSKSLGVSPVFTPFGSSTAPNEILLTFWVSIEQSKAKSDTTTTFESVHIASPPRRPLNEHFYIAYYKARSGLEDAVLSYKNAISYRFYSKRTSIDSEPQAARMALGYLSATNLDSSSPRRTMKSYLLLIYGLPEFSSSFRSTEMMGSTSRADDAHSPGSSHQPTSSLTQEARSRLIARGLEGFEGFCR